MAYVYILVSQKDQNRYIGSTINLEKRIKEHNSGKVISTRNRRPLNLFAYQEFGHLIDARSAEKKYKRSLGATLKAIDSGLMIKVSN